MRKRLLAILFLLFAAAPAVAVEFTDVYYDPLQSGWGLFVIQSDTFQFFTLFIHGPDGKPLWYGGGLTLDPATGVDSGKLFATAGTYFADPWAARRSRISQCCPRSPSRRSATTRRSTRSAISAAE